MHKYDYAHIRTRYFFLHFGETEERVNDRRRTDRPTDAGHISTDRLEPARSFFLTPLLQCPYSFAGRAARR